MVVFRSRQFAYENTVAWWTAVATAAMLVAAFTIADAWSHAPWAIYGALALLGLVLTLPQTITVDDTHVRVRLAGALRRDIALADVSAVERRGYRPLREFGGWGWRRGLTHRDARAYTTTGDTAVVLSMRDGEEVYLGVADESGLKRALQARIGS